jgi:hypothetical protein
MLNGCGKPWIGGYTGCKQRGELPMTDWKRAHDEAEQASADEVEQARAGADANKNGERPPTAVATVATAPFVPLAHATSKERKMMPVISGVLDYFPDAIAAVAYVSYLGNQKHNPGQALHWARGKSDDHIDCLGRHLLNRDGVDQDGIMESAEMVWRALAVLQLQIEKKFSLPLSRGSLPRQ